MKRIELLVRNLWEILENCFDASYERAFNSEQEEKLRNNLEKVKKKFLSQKEKNLKCLDQYKWAQLFFFGISVKLFAKLLSIPNSDDGILNEMITQEKYE